MSAVVQKWVEKIGQHLGILIRHTERLSKVLGTRARNIRRKVQGCTGSVPKQRFLQLKWELQLLPSELVTNDSKLNELELQVHDLKQKNASMGKAIDQLKSDKQNLLKKTSALTDRLKIATMSPQPQHFWGCLP